MTTVEMVDDIISDFTPPRIEAQRLALNEALGRVLAEPIVTDRPLPPFHRVAMDGYAFKHHDFEEGRSSFKIAGIQAAGALPLTLDKPGEAIEIMTGAQLPNNADMVVPYELCEVKDGTVVPKPDLPQWANVHLCGSDREAGSVLANRGHRINSVTLSAAASVGMDTLLVENQIRVTFISTGDELVSVRTVPLPHQIRRSNDIAIESLLSQFSEINWHAYHVEDSRQSMEVLLEKVIPTSDVVLLSGGVSKGKYDFVPEVLEKLKVEKILHRVQQRPGKPLWLGRKNKTIVFGLPGNPMSSLICARRYVWPYIEKSLSRQKTIETVEMMDSFEFSPELTLFQPVLVTDGKAKIVRGNGSGDFASIVDSSGFIEVPAEHQGVKKGVRYQLYRWFVDA